MFSICRFVGVLVGNKDSSYTSYSNVVAFHQIPEEEKENLSAGIAKMVRECRIWVRRVVVYLYVKGRMDKGQERILRREVNALIRAIVEVNRAMEVAVVTLSKQS